MTARFWGNGASLWALQRRVWYGGRKGRAARRRLRAGGVNAYEHDGAPPWTPRCPECSAPKRRHHYPHWDHCSRYKD